MSQRNTKTRDAHRAAIARSKPPCALCGEPIDYTRRWPDAECFVVDHIVPVALGGEDTIENKQPAHNRCNSMKRAKIDHGLIRRSGSLKIPD